MRLHRKVWLWWGKWWAAQFTSQWDEFPLGIRPNLRRPLLDIYLGPLTIAFGWHAVYTDPRTREWHGCRGMLFPDDARFPFPDGLSAFEARVL